MWEGVNGNGNGNENGNENENGKKYNYNYNYNYSYSYSMSPFDNPNGCTLMDVEFVGGIDDSSSSWPPFDHLHPLHHLPPSPLYRPFSPLWAFSDDFSRFPSSTTEPVVEKLREDVNEDEDEDDDKDDKNKVALPLPPPLLPTDNLDVSFIIKEKITQALRSFKETTEQHQILAQVWAPVRNGNRVLLTTCGQPFVLDPHSNGLNQYRTVSLTYMFAADTEMDTALGLPGRVYRHRLPEWTPNVQYYSSKEYNRVDHAKTYNVKGTLALPIFETSRNSCLAVLELIMSSPMINYAPEVDKVCRALQAVNLKSSEILDHPSFQICNKDRQNALAEILEVLTEVCETYKLPLAQTWVPCKHRSVLANGGGLKKSCSSFDGSCMGQVCMSTSDVSFYIVDAHIWGFREACAEHHLQKNQGVAGRAFSSHGLSFCRNISNFLKIEYPLVHYARMFGLTGCFAICLRSKYTGDDDYVLEFFLPPSITDSTEQQNLLDSILATMKSDLQNLVIASGRTLEEERKHMEIIEVSMDENHVLLAETNLSATPVPVTENIACVLPTMRDSVPKLTVENEAGKGVSSTGCSNNAIAPVENKLMKKTSERKRGKAEKQISLEVLQQYFSGSLKDAAKSLGVCPTTMKRICRQHGISRWPSRKINKVNRSLTKLKQVIESVQGTDGTFSLTSLAPSTMPVPVGSTPWTGEMNGNCQLQSPASKSPDIPDDVYDLPKSRVNGQTNFRELCEEGRIHEQNGFTASKTGSGSKEVSSGASTSHGSCHNSPEAETNLPNGQITPNFQEQGFNPTGLTVQQNGYPRSEAFFGTHSQELFNVLLIADAGSSKDLRNLECDVDEVVREQDGWTDLPYSNAKPLLATSKASALPKFASRQEMKWVTIKATFREDIIRFKLCLTSNIDELKEEVAKRLKIEVGTFEIKYMDDDHEWVLIACDSDLQECLDLSKSSGNVIRLLIHDISVNLGSSCESSGE